MERRIAWTSLAALALAACQSSQPANDNGSGSGGDTGDEMLLPQAASCDRPPEGTDQQPGQSDGNGYVTDFNGQGRRIYRPTTRGTRG